MNKPFALLVLLFFGSGGFAKQKVGQYPEYYIDSGGTLGIDEVSQIGFQKAEKPAPSWGWTSDVIWIKFEHTRTKDNVEILEIGYPLLDDVQIYIFKDGLKIRESRAGDSVLNTPDIIDKINPAFKIPDEPGHYQYYFRIETSSSIQAPLTLYEENEFVRKEKEEFLVMGLYSGILLIMGVYNLIVFFSTRYPADFYYSAFVLIFLMLQTALSGFGFAYLWPKTPVVSDYFIVQGGFVATILMVLFADSFLGFKFSRKRRIVRSILTGFLGFSFLTSFFVSYGDAVTLMAVTSILTVSTILAMAFYNASFEKQREAKLYCIAWTFFIGAVIVYVFKQLGVLPVNWFTNYSLRIGSVVEVTLLSIALGDRYKEILKQAENSHRENAKIQEKMKLEMKMRVEIVAGLAHRMNNPLNYIMTSLSVLIQEFEETLDFSLVKLKNRDDTNYLQRQAKVIEKAINNIETGAKRSNNSVQEICSLSGVDGFQIEVIKMVVLSNKIRMRLLENWGHDIINKIYFELGKEQECRVSCNTFAVVVVIDKLMQSILSNLKDTITIKYSELDEFILFTVEAGFNEIQQLKTTDLGLIKYFLEPYGMDIELNNNSIQIKIPRDIRTVSAMWGEGLKSA